jgi:hypothetical protein
MKFQRYCNTLAVAAAGRAPADARDRLLGVYGIPGENGNMGAGAWRWNSMQLRRTLAWYIANQPFGVVAGMLQYGHTAEVMFEGYAGRPQSGFRSEIDEERALRRLRDVVADFEDWKQGDAPQGPMGARIASGFEQIQAELDDLPGVVVDVERRNAMLKNLVADVHPGFINDCHFHKEHALCLARRPAPEGAYADAPFWSSCDAERCPNSSITRRHLPALKACIVDAEGEMVKVKGQSPLQRKAIHNEIVRVNRMIERIAR